MGKYADLAETIIKNVGGKENIQNLVHCITRLRFSLVDDNKPDDNLLKNTDGVVTVIRSGGQYQIVIGNHVGQVYDEIAKRIGLDQEKQVSSESDQNLMNRLIDTISSIFQPFLGVLCASGMIKGVNALLLAFGVLTDQNGTYQVLNGIGDTIFMFLPIAIGITAAKKFEVNQFVGMVIGGALCYPTIQLSALSAEGAQPLYTLFSGSLFESPVYMTFLKIPFIANNYTSSVVPSILIVWLASKLQRPLRKLIPEIIQNFFLPFFLFLICLPIGFLVVGPVITVLTNLLANSFDSLMNFSPLLFGALVGFFWQVMVMFGLHWSLMPIYMLQLATLGYSTALIGMFGASFAQTAAVAAMYFKLNNPKEKALVFPAVVSGICGVTEPAIYGLSLPKKKPFIFSMIGGGVSGAFMTGMNVRSYVMGGLGIFGIPSYINQKTGDVSGAIYSVVAILIAAIIGFVLTFFFWKDDEQEAVDVIDFQKTADNITSPVNGTVSPLTSSSDEAFAQGLLGKGVVVHSSDGTVTAPFDGTVMTIFPTKHAIGIVSDQGVEVLIHIGINTVKLKGKYFESFVKQGDKVKQGQTLITFDKQAIEAEGYSTEIPVIITNTEEYRDVIEPAMEPITINDPLLTIKV